MLCGILYYTEARCSGTWLYTALHNVWLDYKITHLTHWNRVTHICVSKHIGHHWFSQWLVACSAPSHYLNKCWGIFNWTLQTNFSKIWIEIQAFSLNRMHFKLPSAKRRSFCFGLKVLNETFQSYNYITSNALCMWNKINWPTCKSTCLKKRHVLRTELTLARAAIKVQ